jgi:CheY-like chemotaxis protein
VLGFSSILLGRLRENNIIQDKRFLESIYSSGKSLLSLVNTVHDFTKLDLNELKIVYKEMAIIKFFKDISLYYTNECMNKGVKYILELDDKLPHWIESDEIRLKQVLDNILNNALKFTDNGHIKVVVKSKSSSQDKNIVNIVIQIMDTGRGIDKEKLGELFKRFSQVHDEISVKERGTGLGLYISKEIINKLGGVIGVESNVGKGTTFIIELPNVIVLSDEEDSFEFIYNFFGDTVLIADDFPVNIELLEAYLSPYDLNVETAKNGEELVRKAKNSKIGLIITDLKMPGFGGELALKELRKNNIKTPIILISALKVQDIIKKEFNSFLQKPIEETAFIKEVSRFLKHKVEKKIVKNNSYIFVEFLIPDHLEEIEYSILLEIRKELVKIKGLMDMKLIEETSIRFKEKIKGTKLFSLSPWFEELKYEGDYFNVSKIVLMLNKALEVLDKI